MIHATIAVSVCFAQMLLAEPNQKSLVSNTTEQTRIAIMQLSADGVPEAYAVGLTETVATTLDETGIFETISPKQISSVLAYEKRRDALGDCSNEECYTQIAKLLRADYLISGSVAKVSKTIVVNLALIHAEKGEVTKRVDRRLNNAAELILTIEPATISLVQPLLSERQGYLRVTSNVDRAKIYVDDQLQIENIDQLISLSAGPHTLTVVKDGFYQANGRFSVKPGLVQDENITLIPAQETIATYESKANAMRYSAYATGILALGSAFLSGYFYNQATDNKLIVDSYASALESERAQIDRRNEALSAKDSFDTNQSLYIVSLSTAVLSAAGSALLFMLGEDPDRYDAFSQLEK